MGARALVWSLGTSRRTLFSQTNRWDELSNDVRRKIETAWRPTVLEAAHSRLNANPQDKMYCLAMFPYPSGNLHMGHARVYTISDTLAHFYRMNGKYVIHPMGWDAFGLPAENAARVHGIDPRDWTKSNVARMRQQLDNLGVCLDWDRELNTSQPEYYKATQQIFIEMLKKGLVYRDKSLVNWDPVDQTVLAEEQVDKNGCSWRSGAKVEKKSLTQWFIRTTKFAKRLLDGLESPHLEEWRDIINLQRHWIGKCDGYFLNVKTNCGTDLKTWTRQPEEGGMFVAVKKSHPLSSKPKKHQPCPEAGLLLESTAIHPLHDCPLPVIALDREELSSEEGAYLGVASWHADSETATALGLSAQAPNNLSRENAVELMRSKGVGSGDQVSHHLRDWLVSRQRRWGTPIPIVLCKSCGPQPLPQEQLPLLIPPPGTDLQQWKCTTCPKCGEQAERETDTMDTFVDSSWYYLRFLDPHNAERPFDPEKVNSFMPVDLYIGGKEHAVLHMYYARFMGHFLHSLGWLDQPEPFSRLLVQGMVMGKSYRLRSSGKYLRPEEVDASGKQPVEVATGEPVAEAWEKMSKSKMNGVEPEQVVEELGCDAARLLLLADVAPTSNRKWSKDTYPGILNWQRRLWLTVQEFLEERARPEEPLTPDEEALLKSEEQRLWDARNFYLSGTTFNYGKSQQLSVAVTKMQGLTNSLRRTPRSLMGRSVQFERALLLQLVMLAPMAPHFVSELWAAATSAAPMKSSDYQWEKTVLQQTWPKLDPAYLLDLNIILNGKEVANIKVNQDDFRSMVPEEALRRAMAVYKFSNMMGKWEVTDVLLDRKQDYQMNAFITSVRPAGVISDNEPQEVAQDLQKPAKEKKIKKTKKPRGINKKDIVAN